MGRHSLKWKTTNKCYQNFCATHPDHNHQTASQSGCKGHTFIVCSACPKGTKDPVKLWLTEHSLDARDRRVFFTCRWRRRRLWRTQQVHLLLHVAHDPLHLFPFLFQSRQFCAQVLKCTSNWSYWTRKTCTPITIPFYKRWKQYSCLQVQTRSACSSCSAVIKRLVSNIQRLKFTCSFEWSWESKLFKAKTSFSVPDFLSKKSCLKVNKAAWLYFQSAQSSLGKLQQFTFRQNDPREVLRLVKQNICWKITDA